MGAVLLAGWFSLDLDRARQDVIRIQGNPRVRENPLVLTLRRAAARIRYCYSRNPAFPVQANCLAVPELTIMPWKRFWSGDLTESRRISSRIGGWLCTCGARMGSRPIAAWGSASATRACKNQPEHNSPPRCAACHSTARSTRSAWATRRPGRVAGGPIIPCSATSGTCWSRGDFHLCGRARGADPRRPFRRGPVHHRPPRGLGTPTSYVVIDVLITRHGEVASFAFADRYVELRRRQDPLRTWRDASPGLWVPPTNRDARWLQEASVGKPEPAP